MKNFIKRWLDIRTEDVHCTNDEWGTILTKTSSTQQHKNQQYNSYMDNIENIDNHIRRLELVDIDGLRKEIRNTHGALQKQINTLQSKLQTLSAKDIIVDECDCCDDTVTQEDLNFMLMEDIEKLTPKKKKK